MNQSGMLASAYSAEVSLSKILNLSQLQRGCSVAYYKQKAAALHYITVSPLCCWVIM